MYKVEGIKSGGFQISMEDLKIRGAGEILGEKQHGTIETFGYDLYIKMLNDEIKKQKGQAVEKIENVEIILKEKGYIPEKYIYGEERLNIYKRFAMTENYKELDELSEEIRDRFGKIPEIMKKFILSVKFKIFSEQNRIQRLEEKAKTFELNFIDEGSEKNIEKLENFLDFRDITKIPIFEDEIARKNNKIEIFISKETDKKKFLEFINNLK